MSLDVRYLCRFATEEAATAAFDSFGDDDGQMFGIQRRLFQQGAARLMAHRAHHCPSLITVDSMLRYVWTADIINGTGAGSVRTVNNVPLIVGELKMIAEQPGFAGATISYISDGADYNDIGVVVDDDFLEAFEDYAEKFADGQ